MKFNLPQSPLEFSYDPDGLASIVRVAHQTAGDDTRGLVIAVRKLQASTVALWMDGQYTLQTKADAPVPFPLRIEWKLWSGVGCQVDEDPLVGVTILKNQSDFDTRQGMFFQIDCRVARTLWLTARIVDDTELVLQLPIRTFFWPLSGRPEGFVGTAIG